MIKWDIMIRFAALEKWLDKPWRRVPGSEMIRKAFLWGIAGLFILGSFRNTGEANGALANPPQDLNRAQAQSDYPTYLPLVIRFPAVLSSSFALETENLSSDFLLNMGGGLSSNWLRVPAFAWNVIEPLQVSPPVYHWDMVDEITLLTAVYHGFNIIAVVKFAPSWAQKIPGKSCGPISTNALDNFAQFMQALVARYGAPPYNIKYWEIGNEPDVDPSLVPGDSPFGCWGNENDVYYGGGYYAEMLKRVYPAIKAVDPQAQLSVGGLLLFCDPTHQLPNNKCKSSKFLEGILRNQGAQNLDLVSFHSYPHYVNGLIDENYTGWNYRGGIVVGKADFLREVMASYGTSKPLMLTETSLLCPIALSGCNPAGPDFFEAQADFVIWLYVRNWAAQIQKTVWFTIEGPGWQNCGLLRQENPKPAYNVYQFMSQEIGNAYDVTQLTDYPELSGYEFHKIGMRVWVLWAPDQVSHAVPLPGEVIQVFDKYGNIILPQAGKVTVKSPIYVELAP